MLDTKVLAQENGDTASFVLDRWLVEPSANQLRHLDTGEQRSLEPRLMQLLCVLASAPGTVHSRETLIQQIWPKVVVNENSLTRAISELRKKLATPEHTKRVIETIPKTGYRLAAHCTLRAYSPPPRPAPQIAGSTWHDTMARFSSVRHYVAASALAITAIAVLGIPSSNTRDAFVAEDAQPPLADINISATDTFSDIIRARVNTVATSDKNQSVLSNNEQAVISRDGRLFALIRYDDEGSSLLLGSTDLPNSPVTVLSTHDTLYNLQWSPIDRALLFAQAPRITNAALLAEEQASLVMFDIDTFTTKVIQRPGLDHDGDSSEQSEHFKLTALAKPLAWLS